MDQENRAPENNAPDSGPLPAGWELEERYYLLGDKMVDYEGFKKTPMGKDMLVDGEEHCSQAFRSLMTRAEYEESGDPFALQEMADTSTPWKFLTTFEKVETVVVGIIKFALVWAILYMFIISLGLMGNAFKILGGRSSGKTFRESELLGNPIAGLAIGILATVLMQSSSTTTSIVITMAAANLVTVEDAAYLVMGANIGTSVTNTIVSIAHLNSAAEYRRAFSGAVYHDMFNWLTVLIFLPLEASSGFLMELASACVDSMGLSSEKRGKVDFIKKITSPASGRVISVDKDLITKIAAAKDSEEVKKLEAKTIIKQKGHHVFRDYSESDNSAGVILLVVSLVMLTTCLLLLVKLLQSVLKGRVALWTRYLLNIDFKHPCLRSCGGLDGYILLFFGTACTILVQSSSVFTSTITPLVGIGLIHIEKLMALTQGANIGTTVTGVLSALAGDNVDIGMRVALEHVFFNVLGTVVWFVIWPLRCIPLGMAKFMGETAATLRWFPLVYIVVCFLALPGLVVLLSIAGWEVLVAVFVPVLVLVSGIVLLIMIRRRRADLLARGSFLRSERLCGFRLPNFMQLWGGDHRKDMVDVKEMQRKALEKEERDKYVLAWPHAPGAWGMSMFAFMSMLLALPTSQYRRASFDGDVAGRKDHGFAYDTVCSSSFKGKKAFAAPREACTLDDVKACASEIALSCSWTDASEKTLDKIYAGAYTRCSAYGCDLGEWLNLCPQICGSATESRCEKALDDPHPFVIGHSKNLKVTYEGDDTPVKLPALVHDNHLFSYDDDEDDLKVFVESYGLPASSSYDAFSYDACTGSFIGSKSSSTGAGSCSRLYTRINSSGKVDMDANNGEACDVTPAPKNQTTENWVGGFAFHESRYLAINGLSASPQFLFYGGNVSSSIVSTTGANHFRAGKSIFAAAPDGSKAIVCETESAVSVSNVVRCVGITFGGEVNASISWEKILTLSDPESEYGVAAGTPVTLKGVAWLAGEKAIFLESCSGTFRLVEVDFGTGKDVKSLAKNNDIENVVLEGGKLKLNPAVALTGAGYTPVTRRMVADLRNAIDSGEKSVDLGSSLYGLAVLNKWNVAVGESGKNKLHKIRIPEAAGIGYVSGSCANKVSIKSTASPLADGPACRDMDEICPEGGLKGDLKNVWGLGLAGTIFLVLSLIGTIVHCVLSARPFAKPVIFAAAGLLFLAWILLLASWAHLLTLEGREYKCLFPEGTERSSSRGGGLVWFEGKLEYLTHRSGSWGFTLFAWILTTVALGFILHRVLGLLTHKPEASTVDIEPEQEGH